MPEHNLLIHSCSPCCPIEAFLEEDGNTCYFYLWIKPETDEASMHACFVSNVKDKCHAIPYEEWKKNPQGPPMMPYEVVTHSQSGLTFDEEELEIVWTKEGSGAGLLWKGDLIAFIPEWSNEEFPGFSKFVKEQTPYACHEEYDFLMKYDMEKLFHLDLEREMVIFDGTPKVPIERLKELAGKELV